MNGFRKLAAISAVIFIALGIALAGTIIVGIWIGFDGEMIYKAISTQVVLFLLFAILHNVAKGMSEKPKGKD